MHSCERLPCCADEAVFMTAGECHLQSRLKYNDFKNNDNLHEAYEILPRLHGTHAPRLGGGGSGEGACLIFGHSFIKVDDSVLVGSTLILLLMQHYNVFFFIS